MFIQVKGEKLEAIRKLLETQVLFNPIVNAMVSKFTPLEEAKIIRKEDGLMYVYHFGKVTQADAAILKTRGFRILKTTIDAIEQAGEPIEGETPKHAHALTVYAKTQTTGASFEVGETDKLYIISNGRNPRYRTFLLQKKINGEFVDNGFSESKRLNVTPVKFKQPVEVPVIPLGTVEEMKAAIVKLIEPEGEFLFPEDIILSTTDFKEGYGYTAKIGDLSLKYEGNLSFKVGPVVEGGDDGEEPTDPVDPEEPEEPVEPTDPEPTFPTDLEVVGEGLGIKYYPLNGSRLIHFEDEDIALDPDEVINRVYSMVPAGTKTDLTPSLTNGMEGLVKSWNFLLSDTAPTTILVIETSKKNINVDLSNIPAEYNIPIDEPKNTHTIKAISEITWADLGLPEESELVLKSTLGDLEMTTTSADPGVFLREFITNYLNDYILMEDGNDGVTTATNLSTNVIDLRFYLGTGEFVGVMTWLPAANT